ncbi:MAG TPA: hypothetical protein VH041_11350 [Caldimonas sp.]|jgi:hypothetical protein|nr:hypothetical protein [Caldimonas sp.]HEX4234894.1 hypothetical protein [Caldimonas sp.]
MHLQRARPRTVVVMALALGVAACAPALDWREARPESSGVVLMFPCRPQDHERNVALAGAVVPMRLHSCSAGGANFALATLETGDPARVTPELAALRGQLLDNLAGTATEQHPLTLAGSTPNPQSARVRIVGKRPDGSPVVADAAFFVRGLTLYQATVLGSNGAPGDTAVGTFFDAIRLL